LHHFYFSTAASFIDSVRPKHPKSHL